MFTDYLKGLHVVTANHMELGLLGFCFRATTHSLNELNFHCTLSRLSFLFQFFISLLSTHMVTMPTLQMCAIVSPETASGPYQEAPGHLSNQQRHTLS